MDKEISKLTYEELTAMAKAYGLTEDKTIEAVKIDALVILKIIKHCRENLPELVTGQLLGLDVGNTLEITNCYPFPSVILDDDEEKKAYQLEMMLGLREVNVDNNAVGWYTSTFCSFLPDSLIKDQFKYQQSINKCVVLVYDPLKTAQGQLSFKALRLTEAFMDLCRDDELNFSRKRLAQSGLTHNHIFEEIPVQIYNQPLVEAFLWELQGNDEVMDKACEFDRLDLSGKAFLEKNLQFLLESTGDFAEEQRKYNLYQRNLARQQANVRKRTNAETSGRIHGRHHRLAQARA